jgi:hypothetical protein
MTSNFSQALKTYICDGKNRKVMGEKLCHRMIETFEEQAKRPSGCSVDWVSSVSFKNFKFFFKFPGKDLDIFNGSVRFDGQQEDFSEAFSLTFEKIMSTLEKCREKYKVHYQGCSFENLLDLQNKSQNPDSGFIKGEINTLKALSNNEEENSRKWISKTMGIVLTNDLFKKEIAAIVKRKKEIDLGDSDSAGPSSFCGGETSLEVEAELEDFDEDSPDHLWDTDLIFKKKVKKEALFWERGKLFQKKKMPEEVQPVKLGFFYVWMRQCCGMKKNQIAPELKVNPSQLGRWEPHEALLAAFDPLHKLYGFYFLSATKEKLGLLEPNVRCCKKIDTGDQDYLKMIHGKNILWSVYDFLSDLEVIYQLESGGKPKNLPQSFKFEIIFYENLEENQKSLMPYPEGRELQFVIQINEVEVQK